MPRVALRRTCGFLGRLRLRRTCGFLGKLQLWRTCGFLGTLQLWRTCGFLGTLQLRMTRGFLGTLHNRGTELDVAWATPVGDAPPGVGELFHAPVELGPADAQVGVSDFDPSAIERSRSRERWSSVSARTSRPVTSSARVTAARSWVSSCDTRSPSRASCVRATASSDLDSARASASARWLASTLLSSCSSRAPFAAASLCLRRSSSSSTCNSTHRRASAAGRSGSVSASATRGGSTGGARCAVGGWEPDSSWAATCRSSGGSRRVTPPCTRDSAIRRPSAAGSIDSKPARSPSCRSVNHEICLPVTSAIWASLSEGSVFPLSYRSTRPRETPIRVARSACVNPRSRRACPIRLPTAARSSFATDALILDRRIMVIGRPGRETVHGRDTPLRRRPLRYP